MDLSSPFNAGRRTWLTGAAALAAGALLPVPAGAAQPAADYPRRPVRVIVPMPPGGATDGTARLIAQKLGEAWGQSVVVENRAGAGAIVGTQAVARAEPDGYTLGMVISSHTINPAIRSNLPYDTLKDFTALTQIGSAVIALVAHPAFPAQDVAGLVRLARAQPGALEYASLGVGTATHLAGEMLKVKTNVDLVHVPYNGSAPAYNDLLPGRIRLGFVLLESALPHIQAGKLRLLAITNAKRSPAHPDFPTVGETVPGYASESILGFVAPAGVPAPIVQKLSTDLVAAIKRPEVVRQLSTWGTDIVASTPAEFDAFIRAEIAENRSIVKAAGVRMMD
ncbi:MAG: tripartite tricarboxylate transporter substrate binding protein [Pigmentiphaga sp.]|uniref:tripartite tricarboxylate transporter substrate binding protein n=1 Tax=Pigmentiphaga sp. TaxID=1977564 RepID=UPI0029BC217E|nr:tripartite tricarboxylate transporter substrate binding protein [Pigmentiphaga sp.]MDX3906392.1 tripartite tricarboxylate transporter substrate binding protein [Pigmentiphaga sp.]